MTTVVCTACGKISRDRDFCDHCNVDLQPADLRLPPLSCPLPDGAVELSATQRKSLECVDNAATVVAGSKSWRIHWIPRSDQPARQVALDERLRLCLDVLPACRTIEVENGQWLICEVAPATAQLWHDRELGDPIERLRWLVADVASLAHTLDQMHRHGRVWLTFDPSAVEEAGPLIRSGEAGRVDPGLRLLRATNLDLRLFRIGECPPTLRFHAKYAPPEVYAFRAAEIGPATDVYHLAIFTYYWCARLLPDGFAGTGLEAFDHKLPPLRPFAPDLPEGVAAVLAHGLATDPAQRYATPDQFVAALRGRLAEAEARRAFRGSARWDAGGLTRAGRTKEALGKGNEDHCTLRSYGTDPGTLLAAVADGISTCDVGSGALASLIAAIVLENRFDSGSSHEAFAEQLGAACRQGSQGILEWALEKGYGEQLRLGLDLMGTTLAVGWLEANTLSVGNLGDSRAYLVTNEWYDQLTVDGDLGTELLGRGAPPEQIVRMGVVARALRGCVGGCTLNNGQVEILPESCRPAVSRWPVIPGDVIILCTDGLVEEGFFLEPEAMAQTVRAHRALPAVELARRLVEAAEAMQRLPSPTEPEGFGDNITCIVIKIEDEVAR